MKRRRAKALAREKREKGAELLAKATRQRMAERSFSELRRLRGEVQERVEEAGIEMASHNVFAGKSSPRGRRLMWQLDLFTRKGKGKRQRTESALVAADEVLSMNRAQRRKYLGERSQDCKSQHDLGRVGCSGVAGSDRADACGGATVSALEIRPIDKTAARTFVNDNHRHNEAPTVPQITFAVGLYDDDTLVGVATAGRPVARALCDGFTLEINRTCLEGEVGNGNSRLYGAICRAAKALGYRKVVTYTLHEETGASLRAAGFSLAADIGARSWQESSVARPRYDVNLFGERNNAGNRPKYRWERDLVVASVAA